MRSHAGTYVQQKEDVDGQVFTAKSPDRLWLAFLAEDEIVRVQSGDGMVAAIDHAGVDADQGDIAPENHLILWWN